MQLSIEPLQEGDYEAILCQWWKDWRWTPPSREFLPENGMGGFIVYDGEIPICAGFMYITNSKATWCDWIISNLKYKDRQKINVSDLLFKNTKTLVEPICDFIQSKIDMDKASYIHDKWKKMNTKLLDDH